MQIIHTDGAIEQFKQVPSKPMYLASNLGRIFNTRSNKFLKGRPDRKGYLRINIFVDGKQRDRYIHQLVMEAFVGPRPHKYHTNHKDGNRLNNALSNLEYCTHSQNAQHAYDIGLKNSACVLGTANPKAKLTANQVREIRQHIQEGKISLRAIGRMYGVTVSIIIRIKNNTAYYNVV